MKIIPRYLLKEFLAPFIVCVTAFNLLYFVFDLFGNFSKFVEARMPWHIVLRYYGGMVSGYSAWFMPASLMLATLYTLWRLARNNEITAMRSSGISLTQLAYPFVAVALLVAAAIAINAEFVAPDAAGWSMQMQMAKFDKQRAMYKPLYYTNTKTRRVWKTGEIPVDMSSERTLSAIENLMIDQETENGKTLWSLTVAKAQFLDGAWWLSEPVMRRYDAEGNEMPSQATLPPFMRMPTHPTETPHDILLAERDRDFYSLRDMLRDIEGEPVRNPAKWFGIHCRLASPWACVILVLFAIPTGMTTSRQGTIKGIIASLVIFIGFFVMSFICAWLGQAGTLFVVKDIPIAVPPVVAAWLTNAVGITWVALLYRKVT